MIRKQSFLHCVVQVSGFYVVKESILNGGSGPELIVCGGRESRAVRAAQGRQAEGQEGPRLKAATLQIDNISHPIAGGGGKIAVWGGRIQLRKIAEKLRKIAEKLRKNCDVVSGPPEPSRCNNSGQVAQNSQNFTETNSLWAVQLQEAPLNITVELQHEPKAADVVIQFVLPL